MKCSLCKKKLSKLYKTSNFLYCDNNGSIIDWVMNVPIYHYAYFFDADKNELIEGFRFKKGNNIYYFDFKKDCCNFSLKTGNGIINSFGSLNIKKPETIQDLEKLSTRYEKLLILK